MQYNLGSGDTKKEGFINVDMSPKSKPEIVADIRVIPWNWMEDEAERIEADNVFEHLSVEERIDVINECHRKMKVGGILWIRVPILKMDEKHFSGVFADPTHKCIWTMETVDYWNLNHRRHHSFGKDYGIIGWEIIRNEEWGEKFGIIEMKKV
jgi:predicted SAM-dependent methyltransferase